MQPGRLGHGEVGESDIKHGHSDAPQLPPHTLLGIGHVFLPHERLLKPVGIYVGQSQRTSRFRPWERLRTVAARQWGSFDRNCYLRESEANKFHALGQMFAALHRMNTVEFVWLKHFAPVQFNSNLFVMFGSD